MKNKIETFLNGRKKEIIMIGAVLTTACIGGYIGANTGIRYAQFHINLIGPDGDKLKEIV